MAAGLPGSVTLRATSFSLKYESIFNMLLGRRRLLKGLIQPLWLEGTDSKVQVSIYALLLFSEAMQMILSRESPDSEDLNDQG